MIMTGACVQGKSIAHRGLALFAVSGTHSRLGTDPREQRRPLVTFRDKNQKESVATSS